VVLVVLHVSSVVLLAIYMDARKLGKHLMKEILSVFEFLADLAEGPTREIKATEKTPF
jgi:hypothetical protein